MNEKIFERSASYIAAGLQLVEELLFIVIISYICYSKPALTLQDHPARAV
jgi:hypothetical protein